MNYAIILLELAAMNGILALSVYATLMVGQFSLAQVGFWSIGAFGTGILTTLYGFSLLPAMLVAGGICAIVGVLLGYPCLRIRGIYLTLGTVAFSEVVRVFFYNWKYQVDVGGKMMGPDGALGFRAVRVLAGAPQIFTTLLVVVVIFFILEKSRIGLAARAVRDDETAAEFMGINLVVLKVAMFAFGAFVAGIGGGLYASYTSYIAAENFGFHLGLISIFYVAVGGTHRFYGPLLGALILTILPELLRFTGDLRMIIYGVLVMLIVTLFPGGLIGERVRARKRTVIRTEGVASASVTPAPATEISLNSKGGPGRVDSFGA